MKCEQKGCPNEAEFWVQGHQVARHACCPACKDAWIRDRGGRVVVNPIRKPRPAGPGKGGE